MEYYIGTNFKQIIKTMNIEISMVINHTELEITGKIKHYYNRVSKMKDFDDRKEKSQRNIYIMIFGNSAIV